MCLEFETMSSKTNACRATAKLMSALVLFDFDGTITKRNTFVPFLYYILPLPRRILLTLALPLLFAGLVTRIFTPHHTHVFLVYLMRGFRVNQLAGLGRSFSKNRLRDFLRPGAMEAIDQHLSQGDQVAIVTASYDFWIRPWCEANGLSLLSSKLHVEDGVASGKPDLVCDGIEKVREVEREFDVSLFKSVVAYGDSIGDTEMLAFANHSVYRPFREGTGVELLHGMHSDEVVG